jgi:hypothetical protein
MSKIHDHKDMLAPFFILTFLITWGLGALAIFLPVQFQTIFGDLTDTSPMYFLAIAAPTISATILTFAQDGLQGLKSLYKGLVLWLIGSENDKAMESLNEYKEQIPASKVQVRIISGLNHVQEFDNIEQILPVILYFIKQEL